MAPPTENGTTPSFIGALAMIPTFTGEKGQATIRDFIKAVNAAGKLAGCSDEQLTEVAKLKIAGPASYFMDANPDLDSKPWNQLSEILLKNFEKSISIEKAYQKLRECKQQSDEEVKDFATRTKQIGVEIQYHSTGNETEKKLRKQMIDKELLAQFLIGLKPEIARFVATHHPETLTDAINRAEVEEDYFNSIEKTALRPAPVYAINHSRSARRDTPTRQNNFREHTPGRWSQQGRSSTPNSYHRRDNSANRQPNYQRRDNSFNRNSANRNSNSRSYSISPGRNENNRNDRCFNCSKLGHWARDCRSQPRSNDRMVRFQPRNPKYRGTPTRRR